MASGDMQDQRWRLVHRLRAISVDLEMARAAFAREHDLHGTDVRALIHLLDAERAGEAATPGWLGRQLGLTSAATTSLIDRLAAAGHVDRRPDPADRRRVLLSVTDQARRLGWAAFGGVLDAMVAAMAPFADSLNDIEGFLVAVGEAAGGPRVSRAG